MRCRCKECKIASDKCLKYFRTLKVTSEPDVPLPERRKSPEHPSPVLPTPQPSPATTPRTENTPQSSPAPSTPLQTDAATAMLPISAPETSTAMETDPAETQAVPQRNHSLDCNCTVCLTQLLKEASVIAASIPTPKKGDKKPLPKFKPQQTDSSISYVTVAAMAAKSGM
ncbi:putative uncharacterized protein DDB_G0290521 [Palaemon carinicauda]|uniref:putative uncharacterized protein DDB_G0290521 n=1 Tax=Palaemon carinicauda TaxID=392227 RepID=UPI0035B59F8C